MPYYVWCKKEECRLPSFRCLLCHEGCYADADAASGGKDDGALELLIKSGKYKERYVMKRKEDNSSRDKVSSVATDQDVPNRAEQENENQLEGQKIYLMDDGILKPFSPEDYTPATLYQVVDSYSVECRLVRPEDPTNLMFEGKKPSKRTVPIIVTKTGNTLLLESWESLDSNPKQLADALEVIGATPVKQVFVLRRKEE
jgi:hypothetical protein